MITIKNTNLIIDTRLFTVETAVDAEGRVIITATHTPSSTILNKIRERANSTPTDEQMDMQTFLSHYKMNSLRDELVDRSDVIPEETSLNKQMSQAGGNINRNFLKR